MIAQSTLDFNNIVHIRENNAHSEAILDANYDKLNKQCQLVYFLLKQTRLTVREAMVSYNIGDLRRRVCDLRQAGIEVKDNILPGGSKEFFIENI